MYCYKCGKEIPDNSVRSTNIDENSIIYKKVELIIHNCTMKETRYLIHPMILLMKLSKE